MKYPSNQLQVLQDSLNVLSEHFSIKEMNLSNLHMTVYRQGCEGQKHNWLYVNAALNRISYFHTIENLDGWKKLFDVPESFELYPNGCNDTHIETAVKYCLKNI